MTSAQTVRERHQAGVERLNKFFAYDPKRRRKAPRQIGWSRKQRREWEANR